MRPCELTVAGVVKALDNYIETLTVLVQPMHGLAAEIRVPAAWNNIKGCLEIAKEAKILAEAGHVDRANRWLGWIQGTLFVMQVLTIEEIQQVNQGTYDKDIITKPGLLLLRNG